MGMEFPGENTNPLKTFQMGPNAAYTGENLGIPTTAKQAGQGQNLSDVVKMIQSLTTGGQGNPLVMRKSVDLPQQLPPNMMPIAEMNYGAGGKASLQNMFAGMHNLIAQINNAHEKKTARDVEFDIKRLKTAMENDSPENRDFIEEFAKDKKRVKRLEKALDIKLFGEDKNANTPERQGYKNAYDSLLKQFPSSLQIDPQMQMRAQMIQQGMIPKADALLQFMQSANQQEQANFRAALAAYVRGDQIQAMKHIATLRSMMQDRTNKSREKVADTAAGARRYAADRSVDAAKARATSGANSPDKVATQALNKEMTANVQQIKTDQDNLAKLEQIKGKIKEPGTLARIFGAGTSVDAAKKQINEQIDRLQKDIDNIKNRNKALRQTLDTYTSGGSKDDIGTGEEGGDNAGDDSNQRFLDGLEEQLNKLFPEETDPDK